MSKHTLKDCFFRKHLHLGFFLLKHLQTQSHLLEEANHQYWSSPWWPGCSIICDVQYCFACINKSAHAKYQPVCDNKKCIQMLGIPLQHREWLCISCNKAPILFFPPRTVRHFPKVSKIMKHLLLPLVFSYNLTFKQVWHVGLQNL